MGTGISVAAERKAWQEVRELIMKGHDVNEVGGWLSATGLHYAAREGKKDICECLLERGASVHATDKNGGQPLHHAAGYGHADVCEFLVSRGADVTARDDHGSTPLILATYYHCFPALCRPLITGDSVNLPDSSGNRALHIAARKGHRFTVQLLVESGANANAVNGYGQTPLHTAADRAQDSPELCGILLTYDAKCRMKDEDGNRPLHLVCKRGHRQTGRLLVSHGADTDAVNNDGRTPLHEAADRSDSASRELCGILLTHGADVNAVDRRGDTPNHLAAHSKNIDVLRLFSEHGADWKIKNRKGLDVLEMAQLTEDRFSVNFIMRAMPRNKTNIIRLERLENVQEITSTDSPIQPPEHHTFSASSVPSVGRSGVEQLVEELLLQIDSLQSEKHGTREHIELLQLQLEEMCKVAEDKDRQLREMERNCRCQKEAIDGPVAS